MATKSSLLSTQPSPIYVFVVLALATFLTLFTFWRSAVTYQTEVAFYTTSSSDTNSNDGDSNDNQIPTSLTGVAWTETTLDVLDATSETQLQRIRDEVLTASTVVQALVAADMVRGDDTQGMLRIGQAIADRLEVRWEASDARHLVVIGLPTEHPESGIRLLDSLGDVVVASETLLDAKQLDANHDPASDSSILLPAKVVGVRRGPVSPGALLLLLVVSTLVGQVGYMLTLRTRKVRIVYSQQEVSELLGLPVMANLSQAHVLQQKKQVARRRMLRLAITAAEAGIAAIFLLMMYQLVTQEALFLRFTNDPLAAYGEVLTRVIG